MYKTRSALIEHLKTANFTGKAKSIQRYTGQFSQSEKAKSARLGGLDIPAILVFTMDTAPLKEAPDTRISLFFVTYTDYADKASSEHDGWIICENYAKWLQDNHIFADDTTNYIIGDLSQQRANVLLNDYRHTIIELPIIVTADR